ncbi:LysR substrate-binding domain-containing protein [Rhizobium sp. L1K21]|uniref:LysR substrate-binding domain-containing protein n=1 Tax=Rhizobium sp. L1K21 TaxID=2954933 RepID=UPI002093204A|nr:LysR substrate-binding domain-containing protein [Rhizobium sp. L1K21]MCO6184918.1 LysR substrate-binding domain-containing protein [Rhizobium sp. L1K21]
MTFEQLAIFVAVAEREHLTKAAEALRLTPSAVSASIKTLEAFYNVQLFHRVGRRIELTDTGRAFVSEAKAVLARARAAELMLAEMGDLKRGTLNIFASQTVATYWLPERLMQFHDRYPGIDLSLTVGNTKAACAAVMEGAAEVGFVEGEINEPALATQPVAEDELIIVVAPDHPFAALDKITPEEIAADTVWVLREEGSGTRSEFEAALRAFGINPYSREIALIVPSNEAMLSAVQGSKAACAVSRLAAAPLLNQGLVRAVNFPLPKRTLRMVRHKERHTSGASKALQQLCIGQS